MLPKYYLINFPYITSKNPEVEVFISNWIMKVTFEKTFSVK